jgi:hypothetical protein
VLNQTQDDEPIMGLVEQALARAPNEREAYIRSVCAADPELFDRQSQWWGAQLAQPPDTGVDWKWAWFAPS